MPGEEEERLRRRRGIIAALAVSLSDEMIASCFNLCRDESDDDWRREFALMLRRLGIKIRIRGRRVKPVRNQGYMDTVRLYTGDQFRENFRMTPESFELFENRLSPLLQKQSEIGRSIIPIRLQLLATLWLLATPDSYRSVGDRFDMNKSSLSDSFMRVVNALCSIASDNLKWPTPQQMPSIAEKFRKKGGLPNIIGLIDGTDIEIKAPKENSEYYINRKKRYAINAQLVCTDNLLLINAFIGYAGGVGDLRVLKNSDLWRAVGQNPAAFFPGEEYIIGDKIYPVRTWLIPPYKNYGNLTEAEEHFNDCHAKTRQVIERANSLLKGRFGCLRFLDMNREDMIPATILACCVLHNICKDETCMEDFIAEHVAFLANNGGGRRKWQRTPRKNSRPRPQVQEH